MLIRFLQLESTSSQPSRAIKNELDAKPIERDVAPWRRRPKLFYGCSNEVKNMKYENEIKYQIEARLCDKNNDCRGRVLDIVEGHLGASPNWKIVRSQLLKLFGERGLGGDIQYILDSAFDGSQR